MIKTYLYIAPDKKRSKLQRKRVIDEHTRFGNQIKATKDEVITDDGLNLQIRHIFLTADEAVQGRKTAGIRFDKVYFEDELGDPEWTERELAAWRKLHQNPL